MAAARLPVRLLPWLLPCAVVIGLAELPYQGLSELGFRLQARWPLASGRPLQPLLALLPLVGTLLFLVLAWGPLAPGRGGGITGIQVLQHSGLQHEADGASLERAATARARSSLDLRHQLARLPLLALTHGAGLAVGTESPSAALGASCLLALRERLRALHCLPVPLTAAIGAGAGLGAAFGSPLLGVSYALEELSAERGLPLILPTLLIGAIGSLLHSGLGQPAQVQEALVTGLPAGLWPAAVLAMLTCALAGVGFVRLLVALAPRLASGLRMRFWPTAIPVALALTLLALASGGASLNDGSLALGPALAGLPAEAGFGVPLARLLAPLLSIAIGAPGGLMHDCMALGAVLVAPFTQGWPAEQQGVLAAIGATALFSGACRTPLFCAVFVFTLQGNPLLLPWLLLTGAVGAGVGLALGGPTWNEHQLEAWGMASLHARPAAVEATAD